MFSGCGTYQSNVYGNTRLVAQVDREQGSDSTAQTVTNDNNLVGRLSQSGLAHGRVDSLARVLE